MARRLDLNIPVRLRRTSPIPIYQQLQNGIIEEIRRGRLEPGAVMPSTRGLAQDLAINRKTVVAAYDDLIAQGWLTAVPMRGTFVSRALPNLRLKDLPSPVAKVERNLLVSDYAAIDDLGEIPVVTGTGGTLNFDDGCPDTRLVPAVAFARAYRSSLLSAARSNGLLYGDPRGQAALREALAAMLRAERGLSVSADNICLTRGSQMGLFVAARALVRAGDVVAMEELTYPPAWHVFRSLGAEIQPIRTDENGFDVEHLEQVGRKHPISAVYLTPHRQFPTTVAMSTARRVHLLAIAEQYRFSIIEDDYDHEFNFDAKPLLPMASFAPSKVVYVGSFSKLLAPGFRSGFIVAPKKTIDAIVKQVLLVDRQGDPITERAIAQIIELSELERHARRALLVYRQRRDNFAALLHTHFGPLIDFAVPSGGLAFWVVFRDMRHLDELEARAVEVGAKFLFSRSFQTDNSAPRGLRLGFASKSPKEMAEAVGLLRQLIRA